MANINEKTNALYDACVGYMVSERTGSESWAKVAAYVAAKAKNGATLPEIRREIKEVETQIKHDFSISALPTAWRSAKTTALKATSLGVLMMDTEGNVFGKTAVEREVRALKTLPPDAAYNEMQMHLHTALRIVLLMGHLTEAQQKATHAVLNSFSDAVARTPT